MGRISREKKTVKCMIEIYCFAHHDTKKELCSSCAEVKEYSFARLDKCKYANQKPNCTSCSTHCYKIEMKDRIREVMRYAGPRMFLPHPYLSLMHFIDKFRS